MDLRILLFIDKKRKHSCDNLSDYRGHGSSLHAHFRESKITENQNGIQNNIDNGPASLGNHRIKRLSR